MALRKLLIGRRMDLIIIITTIMLKIKILALAQFKINSYSAMVG